MQKTSQEKFRIEKVIKKKCDKLYVEWKGYNKSFNSWIDEKDSINKWKFSKTKFFSIKCKYWIYLSNYATKTDLKDTTGVYTSSFAKKADLANLKSGVDKLDIDELKNVISNLNNLKNKVIKLDIGN